MPHYDDMHLQGKSFNGSCALWAATRDLEAIAGLARWIPEYQPIPYAERRFIETLVFILCGHDICCAVSGKFGTYTAGMGSRYLHVALFIAITENPHFVSLLQIVPTPTFRIRPFEFKSMGNIFTDRHFYTVTLGDTSLPVIFYPIDTVGWDIGPLCNLEFLNFIGNVWHSVVFLNSA